MKAYDALELAARNLKQSVLRNSLTTMGIAVGVASLVAMLSLGIGLQQLASKRLSKSGLFDTIVVTSRRDARDMQRRAEDRGATEQSEYRLLDEAARQQFEKLPDVAEAYPEIRFATQVTFQNRPSLAIVRGLPASAQASDAFDGMQGRYFASQTAAEAILPKWFAIELLGRSQREFNEVSLQDVAKPLLGQELVMSYAEKAESGPAGATQTGDVEDLSYSVTSREIKLKIVGVTELTPDGIGGGRRARLFVPLQLARDLRVMQVSDLRDPSSFGKQPVYLSVAVRVNNPSRVQSVQDEIQKLGFSAFSILDATRSMQQFFAVLDLFLGIFGSLALAVASIGIVNTLVMAILERRREIGIMKAIGADDADVKRLFFVEAGAMGVAGGAGGVLLGWLIGRVINFGTNIYLHRQNLPSVEVWYVPWWLVASAIAFAIFVSLLAGWYPAARASRLDPVQTLRYE